jgi:hypothetical protein
MPDRLPESRLRRQPNGLLLPARPFGGILNPTFASHQPHTTTLKTEQYPLKIDSRAKV